MVEGASNADDLFDLADVRVAVVDSVTHLGDGSKYCLIGGGVICERDGRLCSSEWCANVGTTTWNFWYGGRYIFLVRVVELTGGGLVRVWEVAVLDADEAGWRGVLYA